MTLNFPNASRRYDRHRDLILFWGHDSSLEVAFHLQVDALVKLVPGLQASEAGYLEAFDRARDPIQAIAKRVYRRGREGGYLLTHSDV